MFGLSVQRHRFFELIGWFTLEPSHPPCPTGAAVTCSGRGANAGKYPTGSAKYAELVERNSPGPGGVNWRKAMNWEDGPHDRYSVAQAIPPAYSDWLGERFLSR